MAIFFNKKTTMNTSLASLATIEKARVHISPDLDKDIQTQLKMTGLT